MAIVRRTICAAAAACLAASLGGAQPDPGGVESPPGAQAVDHSGPPTIVDPSDALPLGSPRDSTPLASSSDDPSASTTWLRTAGSLAVVLALILALWWVFKSGARATGTIRGQLGAGGRAPSGVVSILGRYPISRGHSLVLMKVDRRVLVLDQTSGGFRLLTELTDAEDVASILVKTADEEGQSMSRRFEQMLRGAERDPELVRAADGATSVRTAMAEVGVDAIGEPEPSAPDRHAAAAAELTKAVTIFEGVKCLTESAEWSFAKWETPPAARWEAATKTAVAGRSGAGGVKGRPCWWRTRFRAPGVQVGRTALFFDATGLSKGVLLVNGRHAGRYFVQTHAGEPTPPQTRYYLPEPWLSADGDNELTIFDEHGFGPGRCSLVWG